MVGHGGGLHHQQLLNAAEAIDLVGMSISSILGFGISLVLIGLTLERIRSPCLVETLATLCGAYNI